MFDKKICIENIYTLAKEKNLKIGELEEKAGVSKGYLSRINKEDSTSNPSVDFLVSVADQLKVSLDYLLAGSLKSLNKTESFVLEFLDQLLRQTDEGALNWVLQSRNMLTADNEDCVDNPLIHVEPDYSDFNGLVCYHHVFTSQFYSDGADVIGDGYYCNFIRKGSAKVFLMNVRYHSFKETEEKLPFGEGKKSKIDSDVYELYICKGREVNPICSTGYVKDEIMDIVKKLYENVSTSTSHLGLSDHARSFMREFLNEQEGGGK